MSFLSVLESFIIGPLKLLFEVLFKIINDLVQNPGFAIIGLSLAMNILVLPLYRRADAMQEQARDTEALLHDGVAHIKKTFTGNERMMMLQTYYRQNHYSPTNALRGSVSLMLEIPFFMAAYQFLSHLELLQGFSFGPIADLGAPDGLISVAGICINLLPILMTVINCISSAIYLRGFPLKTKIQLYALAAFFLVLLYKSPAGLVFYWTLNNVFSLCKNIFYKLKNPRKVLTVLTGILGLGSLILYFGANMLGVPNMHQLIVLLIGCLLVIPSLMAVFKALFRPNVRVSEAQPSKKSFFMAALFLTLYIGLLIPSNYIADSPQEYVDITHFFHPNWYIVSSVCLAAGTFLLWMGVFYWLASPKGKVLFERLLWVACGLAVINYMFFGTNLGIVSSALVFEGGLEFSLHERLVNIAVLVAAAAVLLFIAYKWRNLPRSVLLVAVIALAIMGGRNIYTTTNSIREIRTNTSGDVPHFSLSKNGKNVVILFMDRALGEDLPYLIQERPDLMQTFDGFTYYHNTISYGGYTNMGTPPLAGGYEYTPVEMNKRDTESMREKHNESLKVMPVLFWENGYNVTVCDLPYANYKQIPDLSIFDEYEGINKYITKGFFSSTAQKDQAIKANLRNFFCFSLMKSAPVGFQTWMYDNGTYYSLDSVDAESSAQNRENMHVSHGYDADFFAAYEVLLNMKTMTEITDNDENNFLFFYNDTPHRPMLLKEPEYEPAMDVDNTAFDAANEDRFYLPNGQHLNVDNDKKMIAYQTNMATLLRIGDWLDYLRKNDVYDNTRIIIVADHGYYLYQTEELCFEVEGQGSVDMSNRFPLLMVKDFNSTGFQVSDEFMTNADTPTLAVENLIDNPVNPFTGKIINNAEKTAHDQFILTYKIWRVKENNGEQFKPSTWAVITNNIWDRDDWEFITDSVILTEHKIPDEYKKD